MQARLASKPKMGIKRWRTKLNIGCLWKQTMQVMQLSMYNKKVPKLDARVIVRNVFGRAAILSWVVYPKLDQKPRGIAAMEASVGAKPSPKYTSTVIEPTMA